MYHCPPCINLAIPGEYREIAETLFPVGGFTGDKTPNLKAASDFAEALGIGAEYRRLLKLDKTDKEMHTFLGHFRNNLDLLIQKTWVEKADETRKERLQDEIPDFVAGIRQGNFQQSLEEFGAILEELAYLFFGAQSTKDDFTEYTFRIDTQMGLFWWYGGRLGNLSACKRGSAEADENILWAVLLIGICYLTNF
ncbi:MAG: hypothetical protein LBJ90_02150 [Treponema sp.]|jgi:hypothetical protein|nr:hypothetical protein [Treponema sp.]